MRLNKILMTTLLTLFSLTSVRVWGQGSYEKVVKANADLQEKIKQMTQDTLSLTAKISAAGTAADRQAEVTAHAEAQLKSMNDSLVADFIAKLEGEVVELENKAKAMDAKTDSLNKVKKNMSGRLAEVRGEIDGMDVYSAEKKKQAMQDNLHRLEKPYSQITSDEMAAISSTVDEYREIDGYEDYKKCVKTAVRNKQLYDRGAALLSSKFDADAIKNIRQKITPFLRKEKGYELNDGQFVEIDSLDIKLSRFIGGVAELKKIINNVNNDKIISKCRADGQVSDACREAIKGHLLPDENRQVKRAYERYFKLIPYLENAYRQYWQELDKSPLTKTKIEEEILEYIIK